jgi:hypothetical protein
MKRLSLIFLLLLVAICLDAQKESRQRNDEIRSILANRGITSLGWVFGIEQGFLQLNNRDLWIGGGSAGILINHNITIGISGHAFNIKNGIVYPEVTDTADMCLDGGYGGLLLQYTLHPKSPVHVTFSILVGNGGAAYLTKKEYTRWDEGKVKSYHKMIDSDLFYVIEPGAHVQMNLFKFLRLNAGISYCYAGDLQLIHTLGDLMNNFTATIGLEIGKF